MTELIIGPLLRYVGPTDATVWVETDAACEVEVLGCSSPTFRVGDHHYALVHVTGLDPEKPASTRCGSMTGRSGQSPALPSRPA